jgi:subtilisin family serine protease
VSLAKDPDWPTGATGRYLVTFADGARQSGTRVLRQLAGLRPASSADWPDGAVAAEAVAAGHGLVFERLGVAVIELDASQLAALRLARGDARGQVQAVEPEHYVHALAGPAGVAATGLATPYADNAYATWGLQATGADRSPATARGLRVAVLDSGLDLGHPDFRARAPVTASFVSGQAVQDRYGHGTHCIGTSCGRRSVNAASRGYGIASDASLLVGKVLNDNGWGADGWIIAGINWALAQQAVVISLSLGSVVFAGGSYAQAYEASARAALDAGSLVIAAAGNAGDQPVWSPANCPSVLAVGAVDRQLRRAPFSCLGFNAGGGEVDLVGPGVEVFSSAPMPAQSRLMDGTSMAAPHVAGCAALWAAQHPDWRGRALWKRLLESARPLGPDARRVGAGLVQAPG